MAEVAVTAALDLINKILLMMNQQTNLYATLKTEVEEIQKWLQRIPAYLAEQETNEVQKERIDSVRDVAHQIEDVIDELMFCVHFRYHKYKISEMAHRFSRSSKVWNPLSSIQGMKAKILKIRKDINSIISIDQLCTIIPKNVSEEASVSGLVMGQHVVPYAFDNCEIVGFVEQKNDIINWLTEVRDSTLTHNMVATISVVGPGGSGKTALVKNVFQQCKNEKLFDCHAWARVSQSLKLDELLQTILIQFSERDEESVLSAQSAQAKLGRYMQERKYLLVLDDVWSKRDWQSVSEKLPTHLGINGSRIIVTTQKSKVVSFCAKPHRYLINLESGLQESEAWDLFSIHAFPKNNEFCCPPDSLERFRKSLRNCEGLPLAIVVLGELVSGKQENQLLEWEEVQDSDLAIASKVLLPSYKDLPLSLRSCFLYFSAFPRGYSIERGRLIRLWIAEGFVSENKKRLWIAEGFVSENKKKSLEVLAEEYLSELIGRNLVRVSKWDFDERPRYCRVQGHVYDFVVHKAEELNFISVFSEGSDSSGSGKKFRRLSLQRDCDSSWLSGVGKDLPLVRSALFFKMAIAPSSSIRDILHAFKLLRVLDLRDAPLTEFPEVIVTLVLLRYLCLRNTKVKKLPNSIKKLSHLETLDLKRTDVSQLPDGVLQLRNLLVFRCNTGSHVEWDNVEGVELIQGIGVLAGLQKLLLVKPMRDQKVLKELENLVRLRKLGIIGLKEEGGKDLCKSIEKMQYLSTLDISSSSKDEFLNLNYINSPPPHLQHLYLNGPLRESHRWIFSLSSLLKLSLKWSKLGGDAFEALQCLPDLIELEMVDAFDRDILLFKDGSFKKLKILHIERFDRLKLVILEEGSVFELQKLSLSSCANMETLSLGIHNLANLKQLLLYGMPREFIARLENDNSKVYEIIRGIPEINVFVRRADRTWSLERNIA